MAGEANIDLSVVMPTYRRPVLLQDALSSVLEQRDVSLEVLVVDDCPQGSAAAVVAAVGDPRVRYVRNPQPSQGRPAAVRNFGWPLTRGAILHFMDDDDLLPEGLYADALRTFAQHPRIGFVFGSVQPFGEPSPVLQGEFDLFARAARRAARLQRFGSRRVFAAELLFRDLLFVGGCSLMRRRCVEAVGGFDLGPEIMEDIDLLVRITRLYGARYLQRLALYYRVGPSLMHRPDGVQEIMDRSYAHIQANYRQRFGFTDFYALKVAARTLLDLL